MVTHTYHHGDLRAALLRAGAEHLEAGEPFSLRAIARRAGVSAAAPYRHFTDGRSLESALAVDGFDELRADLDLVLAAHAADNSADLVSALGVAYVQFALRRPAVFSLMFGRECDAADSERVRASHALHDVLRASIATLQPGPNGDALALALWSTAHGLACLHLDGKLRPEPEAEVAQRVRSAFSALLGLAAAPPEGNDQ